MFLILPTLVMCLSYPRTLVRDPRIHSHQGRESKRERTKGKGGIVAEKRAKRFRLKEEDDYLWDDCMVARPCHA